MILFKKKKKTIESAYTSICTYQSSSDRVKISSKSRREDKDTEDQNTEHKEVDSVAEHERQVNVEEE